MLLNKKSNCNLKSINEAGRDQKRLYEVANSLLGRNSKILLPNDNTDLDCANNFSEFFTNKLNNILDSLPKYNTTPQSLYNNNNCTFESFTQPTNELIIKLPKSCKSTSFHDPLPLNLVHKLNSNFSAFTTYYPIYELVPFQIV